MRKLRLWVAGALLSVLVSACSSPTMPPYPTPDDTGDDPPDPGQGFVVTDHR